VLVEKDPKAAAQLRANVSLLKADNAKVLQEDALAWLKSQSAATAADTPATTPAATPVDIPADDPAGNLARRFDLAFVDPPFNLGLATTTLQLLQQLPLLQPGGLVYLETARSETVPTQGWETLRDKTLGEVRMQLLRRLSVAQQAPAKPPAGC
jgi:16S rRNA (guanine966-N2)-methyltransferase